MKIKKDIGLPKLHNFFKIQIKDSITGKIKQEFKAENVVLNSAYNTYINNNLRVGPPTQIYYGSGTGTPSANDSGLFTSVGYKTIVNYNVDVTPELAIATGSIELGESDAIGVTITELSIRCYERSMYDFYLNHAMIQDSEGNPISIGPKTETQIIDIYFTIYMECGTGMTAFPNAFSKSLVDTVSTRIYSRIAPTELSVGGTMSYSSVSKTISFLNFRLASTAGNYAKTYEFSNQWFPYPTCDIRALDIFPLTEKITFPNVDAFPTFSFSERNIGAGDGSNRWFNFDNGFFIDGSEIIKVDGVTKVSGIDYVTHQGARNLINLIDCGNPYNSKVEIQLYASDVNKAFGSLYGTLNPRLSINDEKVLWGGATHPSGYLIADFGSIIKIGALSIRKADFSYRYNQNIYASTDGVDWTLIGTTPSGTSNYYTILENLQEYDIRYLWFSGTYFNCLGITGAPSIEFLTAPANGLSVTASWNTGVPPKNANLFYDISWAVTASW